MKTIHLIRCSAGALSIFALAACESHNTRYAGENNRDVTAYPRNTGASMDRSTPRGSRQNRSDANWNGRDGSSHRATQYGDTPPRGATTYPGANDRYAGTLDRVDTRSPAWQNNSAATAGGSNTLSQPNSGMSAGANVGASTPQNNQHGWNNDARAQAQSTTNTGSVNAPSHSAPSNVNDGTSYSDAQMGDQSRHSSTNTTGHNQATSASGTTTSQVGGNTDRASSGVQQGNAYTPQSSSSSPASANTQPMGTAQTSSQFDRSQTSNTTRNTTPQNNNAGGGYSDAQMNPDHTNTRNWQSERGTTPAVTSGNDSDRTRYQADMSRREDRARQDDRRYDDRTQQRNESSYRESGRSRTARNEINRYDDDAARSSVDNRHDGGGYSPALIYPNHGRACRRGSYHSAPSDSGAGTSYPMSWQRAAFRARENNRRWDRANASHRDTYQNRRTHRSGTDDRTWRSEHDRNRSTNADTGRND